MMLQKTGSASPLKTLLMVCSVFSIFFISALCIQSCAKKGPASASNNAAIDPNTDPRLIEAMRKAPNAPKGARNPDDKNVYTMAEKMPESAYDLMQYFSTNIKYPEYAKSKKIEGRVLVKFVVKDNGSIADAAVLRSPDKSLSEEALRVINSMPEWTPGEQGGKKVSVYYVLPITFKLG